MSAQAASRGGRPEPRPPRVRMSGHLRAVLMDRDRCYIPRMCCLITFRSSSRNTERVSEREGSWAPAGMR